MINKQACFKIFCQLYVKQMPLLLHRFRGGGLKGGVFNRGLGG
jgi:hypothetical protein